MNGVARWFDRRGEIPLVAPPGFREYGPIVDDPERPGLEFSEAGVCGVSFAVEYCDTRGRVSTRTIRCQGVDARRPTAIKAFCRMRGETRAFQVDRIISIVDLRTGAFLSGEAHIRLLAPYLPSARAPRIERMRMVQNATKGGVFALLQLAMPDGALPSKAREIVLDYVGAEAAASDCPLPPADSLELWIDNLAPDRDTVSAGIDKLLADKDKFARVLPWLLKIVRTQDALSAQEESVRELIAEVRGHYRRQAGARPNPTAIGALR